MGWSLEGGRDRGRKYDIIYGAVPVGGLLKDIFDRSDCTESKEVIANKSRGDIDGIQEMCGIGLDGLINTTLIVVGVRAEIRDWTVRDVRDWTAIDTREWTARDARDWTALDARDWTALGARDWNVREAIDWTVRDVRDWTALDAREWTARDARDWTARDARLDCP
jgi:hypothetical protein